MTETTERFDDGLTPLRCPECGAGPGRQERIYETGHGFPVATDEVCCEACRAVYIPGYPQRSTCAFCKRSIQRDKPHDRWMTAWGTQFASPECEKAPNPDDSPMPGHEPGTAIVSPPIPEHGGTPSAPPVVPDIPRRVDQ